MLIWMRLHELLDDLGYLLDEAVPNGTRSTRADGEYIKLGGKWKRVPKSTGVAGGTFAGGARPWSKAFDDREHLKAIDTHRQAEKVYREAAKAIDTQIGALKQKPGTEGAEWKARRAKAELVAQRDQHKASAKEAAAARRQVAKDLETARSEHSWKNKKDSVSWRDAEDEAINVSGRSRIRGSDEDEAGSSTPVPVFHPIPDQHFAIGMDTIRGEPEPPPEPPKRKSMTSPGSMRVAPPPPYRRKEQDLKSSGGYTEPEHPLLKAIRTIELGREYYGRFGKALPQAARTIGLGGSIRP